MRPRGSAHYMLANVSPWDRSSKNLPKVSFYEVVILGDVTESLLPSSIV